VKLTTRHQLVPRSIHPFSQTSSWQGLISWARGRYVYVIAKVGESVTHVETKVVA
jgi:hypothetical protein